MTEFANQVAINELEATIKKQNQILLHIKAELEFIKQHPFDMILIGGSIGNISRVVQGQTKPVIDEGCVGCCKVADVAVGLQKELDECNSTIKNFKAIETQETDRLHKTILDMGVTISDLMDNDRRINGFLDEYRVTVDNRDKTIEELHTKIWELERTLPANFWDVVAGRDATIRKQRTTIEDYKETIHIERMDRVTEKESINRKFCEDLRKLNATIEELSAMVEAKTKANQAIIHDKNIIIDEKDKMIEKQGREISGLLCLRDMYDGLSAELSARKHDSEVLKKVVEAVKQYDGSYKHGTMNTFNHVFDLLVDYLSAPEGPPETPIDEPQEITVTFAFLELP